MGDYKLDYFVDKLFVLDDIRQYNFFGLHPVHAGRNMTSYDISLRQAMSVSKGLDNISKATTPEELRRGMKDVLRTLNHTHQAHVIAKHYGPTMCDYVNTRVRNARAFDKFERLYRETIGLVQTRRGTQTQVNDLVAKIRDAYNEWINTVHTKLTCYRTI